MCTTDSQCPAGYRCDPVTKKCVEIPIIVDPILPRPAKKQDKDEKK